MSDENPVKSRRQIQTTARTFFTGNACELLEFNLIHSKFYGIFAEIDQVSTAFVRIIYEVDWKLVGIIGFGGIAR